jgi:protoheme IX farnesyltransferase
MALIETTQEQSSAALPQAFTEGASPRDYFDLMKPRVMSLVIFTALVGLMAAPGTLHPVLAAVAVLCIAVGAGASGALNMWFDADIDGRMKRTAKRAIPAGRVPPSEAFTLGLFASIASVAMLGVWINWVAAALLAFTFFVYAVIYTAWLKRWTPQNIVIGGAAGAFPPMIGWAAVTGTVSLESIVLFAIIFFWTPPHFWALALFMKDDYARTGVPMLPVVAGNAATRSQIFIYALVLAATAMMPAVLGFAGPFYLAAAIALNGWFVIRAFQLWRDPDGDPDHRLAKRLFGLSILYLFALFGAILFEDVFGLAPLPAMIG